MEQVCEQLKYTIIRIENPQHRKKLQEYLNKDQNVKGSYCRFFLRGNCVMKPQFCRFAHSFQQLNIQEDTQPRTDSFSTEKQKRKQEYQDRKQFNQKALFILRYFDYIGLYQLQFQEAFKKKDNKLFSVEEISEEAAIRHNLRKQLHQYQFRKLLNYLQKRFPKTDFKTSFLNLWFDKVGFAKPQTRCKFEDFLKFLDRTEYKSVSVTMPPRLTPITFFINCKRKETYLEQNLQGLLERVQIQKQKQSKLEKIALKQLPAELQKKFICRYLMSGHCFMAAQQCPYAHSIEELRYEKGQKFPQEYRQSALGLERRSTYCQLYRHSQLMGNLHSLSEIDQNPALRALLRKDLHHRIYKNFIEMLFKQWQLEQLPMTLIEKQYNAVGFNHTVNNKFGQLRQSLWQMGYLTEELAEQEQPLLAKKTYLYRIPKLSLLDQHYKKHLQLAIIEQVHKADLQSFEEVLESNIRKNVYSMQLKFEVPLHSYLRLKNTSFQKLIEDWFPEQALKMFFQTNEENRKKVTQIVRKYFKQRKQYIHELQKLESYVKTHHQNSINLNHFVNLKQYILEAILECGKRIYSWPFSQCIIAVDQTCFSKQQKQEQQMKTKQMQAKIIPLNMQDQPIIQIQTEYSNYLFQRVIVIDREQSFNYAKLILMASNKYGVDLQGKLSKQGKIDLIQFSVKTSYKGKQLKQIFIFDLFLLDKQTQNGQQMQGLLRNQVKEFIKSILEDEGRVKILHDCRQDSIALHYALNVTLKNVFDTAGNHIYFEQVQVYETDKTLKPLQLIRKLSEVKAPGLNSVLERWGAPNGINIWKDQMKKKFSEANREYFELRPIDQQFLEYSAQDVEDLIEVYEHMSIRDTQLLCRYIGQIYSHVTEKSQLPNIKE